MVLGHHLRHPATKRGLVERLGRLADLEREVGGLVPRPSATASTTWSICCCILGAMRATMPRSRSAIR
jgi:hypothetical protein